MTKIQVDVAAVASAWAKRVKVTNNRIAKLQLKADQYLAARDEHQAAAELHQQNAKDQHAAAAEQFRLRTWEDKRYIATTARIAVLADQL